MAFTQTMTVQAGSSQAIVDLLEAWHRDQHGVAPGYQRARETQYRNYEVAYRTE